MNIYRKVRGRENIFDVLTYVGGLCEIAGVMAKHKLSRMEQASGLRKALRSRKTPPWLKPGIRRYLRKLEARIRMR